MISHMLQTGRTVLFFLLTSLAANAGDWQRDSRTAAGRLEFQAIASPGSLKIDGKVNPKEPKAFQWPLKEKGGVLHAAGKFKVAAWDTGLELRNSHLRDNYLEAKKYPESTFKMTPQKLPSSTFRGELTLHGKTRPVSGELKTAEKDVEFRFPVKLSDFEITIPSFMGVSVSEEVWVTATFKK